jgi:hypothetical protein
MISSSIGNRGFALLEELRIRYILNWIRIRIPGTCWIRIPGADWIQIRILFPRRQRLGGMASNTLLVLRYIIVFFPGINRLFFISNCFRFNNFKKVIQKKLGSDPDSTRSILDPTKKSDSVPQHFEPGLLYLSESRSAQPRPPPARSGCWAPCPGCSACLPSVPPPIVLGSFHVLSPNYCNEKRFSTP